MSHPISRSGRPLTVLLTAVAVSAGTAAVPPAQAAPPVPTAAQSEAVTPEVDQIPIPAAGEPARERHPQDAPSAGAEDTHLVARTGPRDTDRFAMLGVTWASTQNAAEDAAEDVGVEVRVRGSKGWTDWQDLEVSVDGPDPAASEPTAGTIALWVGEADAVDTRVSSTRDEAPTDLTLTLVDPKTGQAGGAAPESAMTTQAAGGVYRPPIVSRRGWGADPSLREHCSNGLYSRTLNVAFVHHTAGTNSYQPWESDDLVRGIYAYHTQGRGWCDIGYNFLVDKYGVIFEGRFGGPAGEWLPVYGAHAGGYNNRSVGVSLMGNFETANPTSAIMNATARIISWKLALNYLNPRGITRLNGTRFDVISGHRDSKSTACPGRYVYQRLGWLRGEVDSRIGSYNSPIFRKWQRMGARAGLAGPPFWGERNVGGGGTVARFRGADLLFTPGPGAHEVHGAIRRRYRSLRMQNHQLGFPTSDQRRAGVPGSRSNRFQHGRIYWSKPTGAREVYGGIMRRYADLGGAAGRLGLPTTGEFNGSKNGSRLNKFRHGRIYWHADTGAHESYGRILARYLKEGGTKSRLGMPTTGEYGVRGGRAQRFQGGKIRWDRSSGKTRVSYR